MKKIECQRMAKQHKDEKQSNAQRFIKIALPRLKSQITRFKRIFHRTDIKILSSQRKTHRAHEKRKKHRLPLYVRNIDNNSHKYKCDTSESCLYCLF